MNANHFKVAFGVTAQLNWPSIKKYMFSCAFTLHSKEQALFTMIIISHHSYKLHIETWVVTYEN